MRFVSRLTQDLLRKAHTSSIDADTNTAIVIVGTRGAVKGKAFRFHDDTLNPEDGWTAIQPP